MTSLSCNLVEALLWMLWVALGAAGLSYIIACSAIMKPLRNQISKLGKMWEKFIHCPFCIGCWLAAIPIGIYAVKWWAVIIMFFGTISIMALLHFIMLRAYEPIAKLATLRKIQEHQKQKS